MYAQCAPCRWLSMDNSLHFIAKVTDVVLTVTIWRPVVIAEVPHSISTGIRGGLIICKRMIEAREEGTFAIANEVP